jgi:hypothetical protein
MDFIAIRSKDQPASDEPGKWFIFDEIDSSLAVDPSQSSFGWDLYAGEELEFAIEDIQLIAKLHFLIQIICQLHFLLK